MIYSKGAGPLDDVKGSLMKVMYDISILGLGHHFPRARTGVFRVVENVAMQLAAHPACEMVFCSGIDIQTINYSLSYLKEAKNFSGTPFSKPPMFQRRLSVQTKKDGLIKEIEVNRSLSSLRRIQTKLRIKELMAVEKLYQWYNNDLIHPKNTKEALIYHSPFYPVPQQIKSESFKSVFLTCYDLIPILFPHYFEQGVIDLMNDIVNSITPETWVLCISEATRNDLLNHLGNKLAAERVIVTELAASTLFYRSTDKEKNGQVRRTHQIPDKPYILSLCTFEPRKNINQVIKAFIRLITQENIPDLYLVLVGTKGWMFDKIFEEIANTVALKERIIITGFVADEDLAALYSDALFFVYPSFYEGFGLPPLEAMKCGTPVITSNTSSLPEVVGDAGIQVAPTDLDALCEAMLSVYKSEALQQRMSVQSLERAALFSWERCAQKTVDSYAASLRVR